MDFMKLEISGDHRPGRVGERRYKEKIIIGYKYTIKKKK